MTHTSLTDIKWQDAVVKNRQHYPRHSYQLMITDFGVGHRCMGAQYELSYASYSGGLHQTHLSPHVI